MSFTVEDPSMNFDRYFDEDAPLPGCPDTELEPLASPTASPAPRPSGFQGRAAYGCTCRTSARCMDCIERDGLTKGVPA